MRRAAIVLALLTFAAAPVRAQPVPGILADRETQALTYEDRLAARKAEQTALDRDEPVKSFEWQGPDGASGIVMVGGEYANHVAMGRCRNFIHIVRHKDDGGANPTFIGVVCRDWEGRWKVRQP